MPDRGSEDRVFLVLLRQPGRHASEMRSDPFWEFGSFGCTGCHHRNLMHHRNAEQLLGGRLAFAQGGQKGFRLLYVTPRIEVKRYRDVIEARWAAGWPFRYDRAPLLIDNNGDSDVPGLIEMLRDGHRSSFLGQFASNFRARCAPLPSTLGAGIIRTFEAYRMRRNGGDIAKSYMEALPYPPPTVDGHRRATYRSLLRTASGRRRC
jgi:hypothetical protein